MYTQRAFDFGRPHTALKVRTKRSPVSSVRGVSFLCHDGRSLRNSSHAIVWVLVLVSKASSLAQPLNNVVRTRRGISPGLLSIILHSPYAFGFLCLQPVNCVSNALRAPAKKPRNGNKDHA